MEILKIGKSTFYKLLHEGVLRGFKEGNRYKVPSSSVDEYISKRMNQ
ncbi:MAG: helix-turn-helix domain-containing protein [Oscillospiraceae bacterium]|nr:helix-turn-helix domain-containing protein [Oscillospiraceae bacterium]